MSVVIYKEGAVAGLLEIFSSRHELTQPAWYAFATEGNKHHVQAATSCSPNNSPWTFLPQTDLLPRPGQWVNATSPLIRAPDVQYLAETDSSVLYYSGLRADSKYHCVGAATAPNITGPYTPFHNPLFCPLAEGGAIDAAGYRDEGDGSRWVVYKVDGSAKGPGGPPCGNGEAPGEPTPLRLQRVEERDGVTLVGEPVTVLDRDPAVDGPLVEAPSLVRSRGVGGDGGCWRRRVGVSRRMSGRAVYV
ncbi:glycosyl hydrolase [Chaetomidium leptoderma]|uniref:Glycosyl hydrolase n=1 Tax=Chaetomidium leptoderma TaxID=669021 RepID=A0AAN6VJN9_9PEZI|nr:glycosyl hydrolase [Chaetomidium leptoderma]